jgi:hypothetical protein
MVIHSWVAMTLIEGGKKLAESEGAHGITVGLYWDFMIGISLNHIKPLQSKA